MKESLLIIAVLWNIHSTTRNVLRCVQLLQIQALCVKHLAERFSDWPHESFSSLESSFWWFRVQKQIPHFLSSKIWRECGFEAWRQPIIKFRAMRRVFSGFRFAFKHSDSRGIWKWIFSCTFTEIRDLQCSKHMPYARISKQCGWKSGTAWGWAREDPFSHLPEPW